MNVRFNAYVYSGSFLILKRAPPLTYPTSKRLEP